MLRAFGNSTLELRFSHLLAVTSFVWPQLKLATHLIVWLLPVSELRCVPFPSPASCVASLALRLFAAGCGALAARARATCPACTARADALLRPIRLPGVTCGFSGASGGPSGLSSAPAPPWSSSWSSRPPTNWTRSLRRARSRRAPNPQFFCDHSACPLVLTTLCRSVPVHL